MPVIPQAVVLTVLLFLAQELLRHAGKWVLWTLFLLAPLVLVPYWVRVNEFGPFLWIKLFSVCVVMIWGTALRFTPLGDRRWARRGIPLMLAVNILEATALDLCEHGLAHGLNAAAGLILVATLPYRGRATRIASESPCRDLYYGLTRGWICAYVAWNWTFVLLNYPALTGQHTAVLAAGLLVAAIDPRRWAQTGTCTLGLMLLGMATFNAELLCWMDTSHWSDPRLEVVAAGISLAFVTGRSVWTLVNRIRERTCSLTQQE